MVQKRDVPGIRPYDAPAGGWGALKPPRCGARSDGTGRAPITLLRTNKPDGFDCPGCLATRSTPPPSVLRNGAKAVTWGGRPASASRRNSSRPYRQQAARLGDFHLRTRAD